MSKQIGDMDYPLGRKIVGVRPMTKSELEANGWDGRRTPVTVLQLDDGSILFPMSDEEGNDAGVIVTQRANREQEYIFATPRAVYK